MTPDIFHRFSKSDLVKSVLLLGAGWIVVLPFVGLAAGRGTTEWPGWRGRATDGAASDTGVFDALEGRTSILTVAWTRPLGSGYSSVSVAEGRAVTLFADGNWDFAAAFDAETGCELWRYRIAERYRGHDGSHDGPISTPLIAGGRVFGLGPRGHLFALDVATGEELWRTDLKSDHEGVEPLYGFATSPLLVDGVLVVELGRREGTSVAAFDPTTGELRWTAGSDGVSYQSPVVFTVGGHRQLLAVGDRRLFGLDPDGGRVLWEYQHGGEATIGALSLNPVPAGEGRVFLSHKPDQTRMVEVRPLEDGSYTVEELWTSRYLRNTYAVPVYYRGYLYGYTSRFLTCLDAATGEPVWRSREPGDGFVIRVDDRLVVVTRRGGLHLVDASPDRYRELASLELFRREVWSPASFAGGRVYARSLGEIAAVAVAWNDSFSAQKSVE